ncbi:MAG: HAMP domain-containing sensor histidine kinase [Mariprofundaceae bacterium]|nr:HAMP domain-containing sensor histidine kinase [Mariprofundaceae bacterium]
MQTDESIKPTDAVQNMKGLLHVFSHDLRNPLLNIQALSQEMQLSVVDAQEAKQAQKDETLQQILDEDLPDTLALLQESTQRMDSMIAGINEIYHCMYDVLQCEQVDMQTMFQRCFTSLNLEEENINLHCDIQAMVYADPWAVKRLVSELLLNASKAIAAKGLGIKGVAVKPDVLPRDIVVEAQQQGELWQLSVADCGCGFVAEEMKRVFEPFFTGSAFEGGAGLGLARVQALLHQQGGSISLQTVENGAKVIFSLPVAV